MAGQCLGRALARRRFRGCCRRQEPGSNPDGEGAPLDAPPEGPLKRRPAGGTILRDLASPKLKKSLISTRISNAFPSLPARLDRFSLYSEAF